MNDPIWYTIDENLATRDRLAVRLEKALAIVQQAIVEVQSYYETGEKALSQTMFGFSRSDREFIEICVHSPSEISVRIELPTTGISRFWRGPFQHEETVQSLDVVEERVRQFFNMAPNELRTQLSYK